MLCHAELERVKAKARNETNTTSLMQAKYEITERFTHVHGSQLQVELAAHAVPE